jgi:hypothetical protein
MWALFEIGIVFGRLAIKNNPPNTDDGDTEDELEVPEAKNSLQSK